MPTVKHRSATPLIIKLRDFVRGRPTAPSFRHADEIAARTQPAPHIPGGIYHKSSKVYYYTRDARRLVKPPVVLYSPEQLESGQVDRKSELFTNPYKLLLNSQC